LTGLPVFVLQLLFLALVWGFPREFGFVGSGKKKNPERKTEYRRNQEESDGEQLGFGFFGYGGSREEGEIKKLLADRNRLKSKRTESRESARRRGGGGELGLGQKEEENSECFICERF
jgi:hypothetical protein